MVNIKLDYEILKIFTSASIISILDKITTQYKPVIFLIVIMIIDTLLGHLRAIKNKTWNSSDARWGVIGKLIELIIIALLYLCEWTFNVPNIANITIIYFILCESASIVENIIKGRLNKYVPKEAVDILENLKKSALTKVKKVFKDVFGNENN